MKEFVNNLNQLQKNSEKNCAADKSYSLTELHPVTTKYFYLSASMHKFEWMSPLIKKH